MTWRELLRRFVRLFLPRPARCPNCDDVGTLVDDYWSHCKGVVCFKWHCESCGFVREGVA